MKKRKNKLFGEAVKERIEQQNVNERLAELGRLIKRLPEYISVLEELNKEYGFDMIDVSAHHFAWYHGIVCQAVMRINGSRYVAPIGTWLEPTYENMRNIMNSFKAAFDKRREAINHVDISNDCGIK